jgi:hypothetical protein
MSAQSYRKMTPGDFQLEDDVMQFNAGGICGTAGTTLVIAISGRDVYLSQAGAGRFATDVLKLARTRTPMDCAPKPTKI